MNSICQLTSPRLFFASFISLVSKSYNPQNLNDFHSIYLVGSMYIIISKLMASRLKQAIGKLVSPKQTTFIHNSFMLDGVLIVNTLVDYDRRNKNELFLFKVDFDKAFDSVSCDYLVFILKLMNFGPKWLKWIQACVYNISMCILIN